MNPENTGAHILLKHSSLWRHPLFNQKTIARSSTCHKQLNEMGQLGKSWKVRNNHIHTHTDFKPKLRITSRTCSEELAKTLSQKQANSEMTKKMLRTLKTDAGMIERAPKLVSGMQKLKNMHLLISKELQKVTYVQKVNKLQPLRSHLRETNPGFGRSLCGRFYTS